MSFANNRTIALWQRFSPSRKLINNPVNSNLYSVEIYPDTHFFEKFNPTKAYEKWAAIQVRDFDAVPEDMEKLIIPKGQYAVFVCFPLIVFLK